MNIKEYISSGVLEEFVLGILSDSDAKEVLKRADEYPDVKSEITAIEKSLEVHAQLLAVEPPTGLKSAIMHEASRPPALKANSTIENYSQWLERVKKPDTLEDMHMEVIDESKEETFVIAWIRKGELKHTHHSYTEKFLIVEGSCDADIDGNKASYSVGDYVEFPINIEHSYSVTSAIPMKVIACLAHSA